MEDNQFEISQSIRGLKFLDRSTYHLGEGEEEFYVDMIQDYLPSIIKN